MKINPHVIFAAAALDPEQVASRIKTAKFAAEVFEAVGKTLHDMGHNEGSDKEESPFGHGDDATVAVSMLLSIGSQIISASTDLFTDGRHYAAAALVRQIVEVEYLAWAFETNDKDATKWLRSTKEERFNFFTPAKLRKAAGKQFRSVDYGHHCELGGHPVPTGWRLLSGNEVTAQLLLSDCLGHAGRIWDHLNRWAENQPTTGAPIRAKTPEMLKTFTLWKKGDMLTRLPPPPET